MLRSCSVTGHRAGKTVRKRRPSSPRQRAQAPGHVGMGKSKPQPRRPRLTSLAEVPFAPHGAGAHEPPLGQHQAGGGDVARRRLARVPLVGTRGTCGTRGHVGTPNSRRAPDGQRHPKFWGGCRMGGLLGALRIFLSHPRLGSHGPRSPPRLTPQKGEVYGLHSALSCPKIPGGIFGDRS